MAAPSSVSYAVSSLSIAYDPPVGAARVQECTAKALLRPYPLGLRFSGSNMDPLPCWLCGAHFVALHMCNNDLPVQAFG